MFQTLFQPQVPEMFTIPFLPQVPSAQYNDYQQHTQKLKDKLFFLCKNKNQSL